MGNINMYLIESHVRYLIEPHVRYLIEPHVRYLVEPHTRYFIEPHVRFRRRPFYSRYSLMSTWKEILELVVQIISNRFTITAKLSD